MPNQSKLLVIGENLRQVRKSLGLSMQNVADQAHVSVATLSRVETNTQGIDLGLFLSLARILRCEPADLLQIGADEDKRGERLAGQIAVLNTAERLRLWRRLATDARVNRVRKRSAAIRQLAMQVEELLAQVDFVRAEIEAVNKRLRR